MEPPKKFLLSSLSVRMRNDEDARDDDDDDDVVVMMCCCWVPVVEDLMMMTLNMITMNVDVIIMLRR